jgi:hypothetical protein
VLPDHIFKSNKSERWIKLNRGGRVDFWSLEHQRVGATKAGRGRKYALAWIDEAALDPNLEDNWNKAIRPTLTDLRGSAWFTSTPKGRDGFYRLHLNGLQGKPGWASWTMPTSTNPVIAPEEIVEAEADLPQAAFQQEFLAEFLADAANPFGMSFIEACVIPELADGPVVCWGVDLAKHSDWTVAVGLNDAGDVCAFQRWQSDWRNTMSRVSAMVKHTPALIDQTGVGDAIVEELTRRCYGVEGFTFTNASKQILFEGLATTIQKREVQFPDGVLRFELDSFIYEYTPSGKVRYTAPDGCHDDCVDALGLAVMCRKRMPAPATFSAYTDDDREIERRWHLDPIENEDLWTPI